MICDLAAAPVTDTHAEADIAIVGAGPAGLLMAQRLAKAGLRVVVLEAGSQKPVPGEASCESDPSGSGVSGIGLGGASTLWREGLLPFMPSDMPNDMAGHTAGWDAAWPVDLSDVAPYLPDVERLLGLPSGGYDHPGLMVMDKDAGRAGFLPRLAKLPRRAEHFFARALQTDLQQARLQLWVHATVTDLTIGDGGRAQGLVARHESGKSLTVAAKSVVLAAGAVETTRLMLLADRSVNAALRGPCDDVTGHYLHDRLSAAAALVTILDRPAFARLAGTRVARGGYRTLRFEPEAIMRREEQLPSGSICLRADEAGPRHVRQNALSQVLQRGRRMWSVLNAAAPWSVREGRLPVPDDASYQLHLTVEQEPRRENRLVLDDTRRDSFGRPLTRVERTLGEGDYEAFARLYARFMDTWSRSVWRVVADFEPYGPNAWRDALAGATGARHPGGSLRMGRDPGHSVVDADLRHHQVANLRIVSTAAFPTAGGADPALTLMLFALRAADDLIRDLRTG